ncbi:MAG: hypothetical protein HETSPECPRED_009681 [Heterodermia speciosa]|uniref:HOOK N-terminal domain-containing protein n=1 Tax=Heterodermia speciosa TaxID=116794 RepID=A0A8H3IYX5_9LECA|nr:MAG: hypothetical protein HETSPECPRED_009681 [Heterodermia speciosa]
MDAKVEQALLEWVNSFPIKEIATDLRSLSSGDRIWEVLSDIDQAYFSGELPESVEHSRKTWWSRWENLKHVHENVVRFLKDLDDEGIPKSLPNPDLKAIAMDSDASNSIKAGSPDFVLIAAIHAPGAQEVVGKMLQLSVSTQGLLMELIKEMGEAPHDDINGLHHDHGEPSPTAPGLDPELQFEARYGKVIAENENLQRENSELQHQLRTLEDRFDRLQDSKAALKERLSKTEDRIKKTGSMEDAEKSSRLLEVKIQQQAQVIISLEDDLAESVSSKEAMKKTVEKLRESSNKAQKLQDQLDVVKAERDGFAKKANAAEKYKQKIQAGQDLQKENKELREELSEVRDLYQGAERARQQVPGLQMAVEDYKRVLEKVEQEHYELQQMKKQLEFDNKALAKRWDEANDRQTRDQESIADLSEKLRTLGGSPPVTPTAREHGGLENEFTGLGEKEQRLRTRLSEQGKENQRLRSVEGELQADLRRLQQTLADVRESHGDRERQHLGTYEKMLTLQSSLAAVQQGQNVHDTESYLSLLNKLDEEQQLRVKLESQTESLKEELETSRQDLSLVDMDKRTILTELKQRQNAELTSLQDKHKVLTKKLLDVELDLAGHRKLLRNDLDTRISPVNRGSNNEILQSINSIKDAIATRPGLSVADFERDVALLGEKILQSNAMLAKSEEVFRNSNKVIQAPLVKDTQSLSSSSQQQITNPKRQSFASKFSKRIKKQNAEIHEARASLLLQADQKAPLLPQDPRPQGKTRSELKDEEERSRAVSFGSTHLPKLVSDQSVNVKSASQAQYIANLERENRLMASAYHTLAGRLQMTNVVLQRHNETPNSWLNKQRRMVDQQIPLPGR